MAQIEAQIEPIRKKYKKITIITTIATIYTAPVALLGLKEGGSFGAPLLIAAIALLAAAITNGRKTSNATPYANDSWNKLRKMNDERRAEHKRILIQQASEL